MFARCTCTCVARCAELSTGLYYITDLYSNLLKVHISTLYLATIRSGIFHSQRFPTGRVLVLVHSHHLPVVLSSQYRIAIATDINSLVHLLFRVVHRILPHTERRGNKKKLFTLYRE